MKSIFLLFLIICAKPVLAQWDEIPDSLFVMGNERISVAQDITIKDVAMSCYRFGVRMILYNPLYMNVLSHDEKLFFAFHELGHHHLLHFNMFGMLKVQKIAELEADCYSVQTIISLNILTRDQVINLIPSLHFGFSPNYPTPQERKNNAMSCASSIQLEPDTRSETVPETGDINTIVKRIYNACNESTKFQSIKGTYDGRIEDCKTYISKIKLPSSTHNYIWECSDSKYFSATLYSGNDDNTAQDTYDSYKSTLNRIFPDINFNENTLTGRVTTTTYKGDNGNTYINLQWVSGSTNRVTFRME